MIVLMDHPSKTGEDLDAALLESGEMEYQDPELYVNWTGRRSRPGKVPVLNANSRSDKLGQLVRLSHQGVKVLDFSLARPASGEWFGRSQYHECGRDFKKRAFARHPPAFWTKFTEVKEEWRLHFFRSKKGNYRLLRSAIKKEKEKVLDPVIRSHRYGWKLSYVGGAPGVLVEEARKAVRALDLDFGAVDLGLTPKGQPVVFEVNTCPGLEAGTLSLYVDEILERARC